MNKDHQDFSVDWVLKNKLAIGKAPFLESDFETLRGMGIKIIFNLCSEDEEPINVNKYNDFKFIRYILPDHKIDKLITKKQILEAVENVDTLMKGGSVYIHCMASSERSPLICISWLVLKKNISLINALNHLREVHKQTNPMSNQINVLKQLINDI